MRFLRYFLFCCAIAATINVHANTYVCNTKNIFHCISEIKKSGDENGIIIINDPINLKGQRLSLPERAQLIMNGGAFSNGTIVSNCNTLIAGPYQIFDNDVTLEGKWVVDNAYVEWFGVSDIDATESVQRCLDVFFKCKLLDKTYNITTLKIPDNSFLAGNMLGRYRMPTLHQLEEYEGDMITTGSKAYSGISLSGFRITGGKESNTAIRISVPNSIIERVFCDQYAGDCVVLDQRAWGTSIEHCSFFGNTEKAKIRNTSVTAILINTQGGKITIDNCDINYYQTGIQIQKGVLISIKNSSISECSRNHFKKPVACISVTGGECIDISDNYIENFSTGISLTGGKQIDIHNNYINGLSVASFGVDISGDTEMVDIKNNHIYMGYKGSWAVANRSESINPKEICLKNNILDNNKLYNIQ